jgi:hypothetical protein
MPFEENVSLDEGVNRHGVRTRLHFEGDSLIVQKTYDADPHLRYAEQARQATEGKRWGEGRFICHIPPAEHAKILVIKDRAERTKAIRRFMQENPAYVMFDRALK